MTKAVSDECVALVTGGGTGIGAAVCRALAKTGVGNIVINYSKSADQAEALVAELEGLGVQAKALRADISQASAVQAMLDEVSAGFGRLDYLVNNAGITELIPFTELDRLTDEVWDRILSTNLLGAFWCGRQAAPMLRKRSGAIVNVSSIAGYRGVGSSIPYSVSKAGVLQLTRTLAVSLAPEIRVNSVSAGTVMTEWHNKLVGAEVFAGRAVTEAETVPMKRLATPEDIAAAIVALLTLDFVTGQDLLIDGGKSLKY